MNDNYVVFLKKTLKYFAYFRYAPTSKEIRQFFPKRISNKALCGLLQQALSVKHLIERCGRYQLFRFEKYCVESESRVSVTLQKERHITWYLKILSYIRPITLIGYSGSMALYNAKKEDDIDLFIITSCNRLWTGRFIALFLAQCLGVRRKRGEQNVQNKVCLNLFFDEKKLEVPDVKKNIYIAHEILQMRPVHIRHTVCDHNAKLITRNSKLKRKTQNHEKSNIYVRFLCENRWAYKFFPNGNTQNAKSVAQHARIKYSTKRINDFYAFCVIRNALRAVYYILHMSADLIEYILKHMQLYLIKRHKTTEIITDTQLWFFPHDFEHVVKKANIL